MLVQFRCFLRGSWSIKDKRKREKEKRKKIYIAIYIYIEREREREKTERQNDRIALHSSFAPHEGSQECSNAHRPHLSSHCVNPNCKNDRVTFYFLTALNTTSIVSKNLFFAYSVLASLPPFPPFRLCNIFIVLRVCWIVWFGSTVFVLMSFFVEVCACSLPSYPKRKKMQSFRAPNFVIGRLRVSVFASWGHLGASALWLFSEWVAISEFLSENCLGGEV